MSMDDNSIPPSIRRSPRAALKCQTAVYTAWHKADDDDDDVVDEAAPAVPRSRSASVQSTPAPQNTPYVIPLAAHHINLSSPTRISQDINVQATMQAWESLKPFNIAPSPSIPPVPHRSPAGLRSSSRTNKRLPLHLRGRTSLETIESVRTSETIDSVRTSYALSSDEYEDEDELDPLEASPSSPYLFALEHDQVTTPMPFDARSPDSSKPSSSNSSKQSNGPLHTGTAPVDEVPQQSASIKPKFRNIWSKQGGQARVLDRLIIERTISVDQSSQRSCHSSSKPATARSNESGLVSAERRSGTSSEWSASDFDASGLTEAELKKCKKKGINPALFAEMKAARKGKWASPIAGITFL